MAQKSLKFKQTTAVSAAVGITDILDATLVSGGYPIGTVEFIIVQAESQNVRWRDDGTDPTASVGHQIEAGQTWQFTRGQFNNLKFIEEAASAKLNVTAYQNG